MVMTTNESLQRIGIIGGGIIGLSMGTILQKQYPNANIQLTCSKRNQLTTSWGAPGFVRLNLEENKYENAFRWHTKGMKYYWELYRSPDSVNAGISINNYYHISDKPLNLPTTFKDLYNEYRDVSSKELATIGFSERMKYGVAFTSLLVESRYYLPYLAEKFMENGGEINNATIVGDKRNVADWALLKNYDIVINCSGLGARELFNDHEIVPLRGQIIRVSAPWFKHSFVTNDLTYAYSCRESVVLGGFRQKNDWDYSIRPHETKNILERIREHNVCLSESPILEEWTGLRPLRENTRIEIEYIESSSGMVVPVIHNYGHGSNGIGLSWGTSLEAADLVENVADNFIRTKNY